MVLLEGVLIHHWVIINQLHYLLVKGLSLERLCYLSVWNGSVNVTRGAWSCQT